MRNVPTLRVGPWKLILGRGSGGAFSGRGPPDGPLAYQLYHLTHDVDEVQACGSPTLQAHSSLNCDDCVLFAIANWQVYDLAANESELVEAMRHTLLTRIVARGRSRPLLGQPVGQPHNGNFAHATSSQVVKFLQDERTPGPPEMRLSSNHSSKDRRKDTHTVIEPVACSQLGTCLKCVPWTGGVIGSNFRQIIAPCQSQHPYALAHRLLASGILLSSEI